MCVIFTCLKEWPSWKLLERAAEKNQDGLGIAWEDKQEKKIRWIKGLKSDVSELEKIFPKVSAFPALIHFRIASVGGVRDDLTHPFPLEPLVSLKLEGSTNAGVMMHNGHWTSWKHTLTEFCLRHKVRVPEGIWSDSRAMAFIAAHLGDGILPFLDDRDRMVVLRPGGRWTCYGNWVDPQKDYKEKGFWISNDYLAAGQCYPKSNYAKTYENEWFGKGVGGGGKGAGGAETKLLPAGAGTEADCQAPDAAGKTPPQASGKAGFSTPGGVNPSTRPFDEVPNHGVDSRATSAGGTSSTKLSANSGAGVPRTSTMADAKRIVTLTEEERTGFEKQNWSFAEVEKFFEEIRQAGGQAQAS